MMPIMMQEIDVLKLVCTRLEEIHIPYMLTGSFAANCYAVPRMTRDIDIVIEIGPSHIPQLLAAFQEDFYITKEPIFEALQYQSLFNILHTDSILKIDFVIRKKAYYREVEFQRKRQIQLDDTKIWIVSPEDLIISKLHWAKDSLSEFQLKDVRNLLSSVQNLDQQYMSKWIRELDLNPLYEKALNNG